jgi:hypothetical protein
MPAATNLLAESPVGAEGTGGPPSYQPGAINTGSARSALEPTLPRDLHADAPNGTRDRSGRLAAGALALQREVAAPSWGAEAGAAVAAVEAQRTRTGPRSAMRLPQFGQRISPHCLSSVRGRIA